MKKVKQMRILFTIVLTIFLSTTVFGTVQKPDKIIYKGKEYELGYSYPLKDYFEKYPDKRPKGGNGSTNLWRGYVATFEIIDNQLYLKDIIIKVSTFINKKEGYDTKWVSVLNEVFPNQKLIKIDWFTGLLLLSYNEEIDYRYAYYTLLELENGEVKKEKPLGNYIKCKEFEKKQFEAFKDTDEYEKIKAKLKNKEEDKDSFLRSFIIQYSSKILVEDNNK